VADEYLRGDDGTLPDEVAVLEEVEVAATILMWGLGKGETEVLSYCVGRSGVQAIIDDLAARRCAAAHDVAVRGTIGLVVLAKTEGRIAEAAPIFEALEQAGLYLSRQIIEVALKAAGEL
jgi:predicted nucleic acid-binding protein